MPGRKKQKDLYPVVTLASHSNSKIVQLLLLLFALVVVVAPIEIVAAENQNEKDDNDDLQNVGGSFCIDFNSRPFGNNGKFLPVSPSISAWDRPKEAKIERQKKQAKQDKKAKRKHNIAELTSKIKQLKNETPLPKDKLAELHRQRAKLNFSNKAFKKVAADIKQANEYQPNDIKNQELRKNIIDECHLKLQKNISISKANKYYNLMIKIELDPKDRATYYYDKARWNFDENPQLAEVSLFKAIEEYADFKLESNEYLYFLYTKIINARKSEASNYMQLGEKEQMAKNFEKAIEYYNLALKYDPSHYFYYTLRGYCFYYLKQYPAAIADYTAALQHDVSPSWLFNRGMAYCHNGQLREAKLDRDTAIELAENPKFFDSMDIDLVKLIQDKLREYSVQNVQPLLKINNKTTEQNEALIKHLDYCIEIDSTNAEFFKERSECHKAFGNIDLAAQDFAEAEKYKAALNPKNILDNKSQENNTSIFASPILNALGMFSAVVLILNRYFRMSLGQKLIVWSLQIVRFTAKPKQKTLSERLPEAPIKKARREAKARVEANVKIKADAEAAQAEADAKAKPDAEKIQTDAKATTTTDVQTADVAPVTVSSNLMPDPVSDEQDKLKKQLQDAKAEFDTEYAAAQSAYDKLEQYYKDKKIYLDQIKEFADSKYRAPLDEFKKFYDHVDLSKILTISQWNKVTTKIQTIKNDLDNLKKLIDPYSPVIGAQVEALKEIDDAKKADAKADKTDDKAKLPAPASDADLAARRKKNQEEAEKALAKSKAIDDAQRDRETKILSDALLQVTYDTKHPYNFKNIDPIALLKFIVDEIKNTKKIIAESSNVSMFQIGWALKCGVMNFAGAISVLLEHFANVDDNRPGAKEMSPYRIPEKRWSVLRNGLKHTKMVSDDKLLGFVKELLKQLTTTTNKEKLVSVSDWLSQQPFFKSLSANLRAKNKSDAKDKKDNINHYPEHFQYVKDIIIPQLEEFSEQKITSDKSAKINKAALRAIIIHAVEPFNSEWQKSLTEREKEDPLTKAILLGRQTIYGKYGAHELPRPEEEVDDQLLKNVRLLFLQVNAAVATKSAAQDSKASTAVVPAVVTNHQKYRKPNRQPTIVTAPGGSAGGPAVDARVLPAVVRSRKKPPPSRVKPKPVGGVAAAAAAGEAAPLVVKLRLE